jgi:hypothetical protein
MKTNYNLPHIKKDSWVKELKKTSEPEALSSLILKRIKSPNITGPWVSKLDDETPIDIITHFISKSDDFKKRASPAIGLILFKIINGDIKKSDIDYNTILSDVFRLIRENNLTDCNRLIYMWVRDNFDAINSDDQKYKRAYKDALYAYAKIQDKNPKLLSWWEQVWNNWSPYWWEVSFYGMRLNDPQFAIKKIPEVAQRYEAKFPILLMGMFYDKNAKLPFIKAIRSALDEKSGWAGKFLNEIWSKLNDADRNEIMELLQNL